MNAPFLNTGVIGADFNLVLAVLIGVGFGFALERGGFGSSRRLAAQFYLYDMTVFKVMFTAIITAMVGLFGLAKLGFIQFDLVYINPTFLWPQIVGGFILGMGFIISGYCPGTSIVATASGKIDGLLTLIGVAVGITLFGFVFTPELQAFHESGSYGRLLLSDLFGIDPMLLTAIIVFLAGLAFIFAEWVEKKFANWAGNYELPQPNVRLRYSLMVGILVVAVLLALPFSAKDATVKAQSANGSIGALDLAHMLVDGSEPLMLFDTRPAEAFTAGAIPGSMNLSSEELDKPEYWSNNLSKVRTYVVLNDGIGAAPKVAAPAGYRVLVLDGGYAAWKNEILTTPQVPEAGDDAVMQEFKQRQALFAYFTGASVEAPKIAAPAAVMPAGGAKKKKPAGGC